MNKISLKVVSKGPIDINPAVVQITAWRRIGNKPLSKPTLIQLADAYIRQQGVGVGSGVGGGWGWWWMGGVDEINNQLVGNGFVMQLPPSIVGIKRRSN